MSTPINLAPSYGRPDYAHAAELRRQARAREAEFWGVVGTGIVGALFFAVLVGGGLFALVAFQ